MPAQSDGAVCVREETRTSGASQELLRPIEVADGGRLSSIRTFQLFRMNNHALNPVDQFECTSLLCSSGCVALPQPRSRIALAAATRAAAVMSFDRMMPTSTLMAVRVWLRASERISFSVLVLFKGVPHCDCEETCERERNQIRRHQPLLVNLNVRYDRCAQSFPARTVIPQPEGPPAAVASHHTARRHLRACRQKHICRKARTTAR